MALLILRSASCKNIGVALIGPRSSFRKVSKEIMLTLEPRSIKALSKTFSPIVQEILKLPGSLSFGGIRLCKIALTSSQISNRSSFFIFLLWVHKSFRNFA
ncbi:hypothetical protein RchiOBHm_Chr7g0215791 [Rosa chinensis]|uniref:Uncharacterized protein n=1 Tax=Rosa chinensis TaxID=74649 RepID=A0A2P6PBK5_ROSCH|nr:hypothetical protein RchiOBHm_Chr7g0215791 [Rosa chinensis]